MTGSVRKLTGGTPTELGDIWQHWSVSSIYQESVIVAIGYITKSCFLPTQAAHSEAV